jgi:beta-lactamase class A
MKKNTMSGTPQKRSFCLRNYRSILLIALLTGGLALTLQLCISHRAEARPVANSHSVVKVHVKAVASIGTLSPSLATYLNSLGSNVGVVIQDTTRQNIYAYNGNQQFLTASSIKVPIMLTLFSQLEAQGREPNSHEMYLLTTMIENSNNDSASALFAEINGATGISNFMQRIGISGLTPNDNAWGYSQITPQTMVNLLTRLQNGTILTATNRATALQLMRHVESDQRWGAGDSAPGGSTVAMKNGWVPGPDNLWSVNSSGIVTTGGETYIVSVYTREQASFANGQAIVQRVCADVAAALQ